MLRSGCSALNCVVLAFRVIHQVLFVLKVKEMYPSFQMVRFECGIHAAKDFFQ